MTLYLLPLFGIYSNRKPVTLNSSRAFTVLSNSNELNMASAIPVVVLKSYTGIPA